MPRIPRSDALPENFTYQDTGCDLAPSCLNCPFAVCRYDGGGNPLKTLKLAEQAKDVMRLRELGVSAEEVAAYLGISRRSAFRIQAQERRRGDVA